MAQDPAILPFESATTATLSADNSHVAGRSVPLRLFNIPERLILLASRCALALAILLLLATAGLYVFRASYSDRIYPAVFVQNAAVGGLAYSDAKNAIDAESAQLLDTEITFTHEQKRWSVTLRDLGVELDLARTLDAAYLVGRETGARDRVNSTLGLISERRILPLAFKLDETTFSAWLDRVDTELGRPAQNAAVSVVDGRIEVSRDRDGLVVDRARARLFVVESLESSVAFAGPLPTTAQPASVHVDDLQPAIQQLDEALSDSIKLAYGKNRWRLTSTDLGQFIVQEIDPGRSGAEAVTITFNRDGLADYLNALLKDEVNRDPKDAVVAWDFQKERIKAISDSEVGARLKPLMLADAVIAAFWGRSKLVEVPITVVQPAVDSDKLDRLGITRRLAVGDSNFYGSDYGRATNIAVGAALLNGTLVPPRGEFSFNRAIGEISESLGYVEAAVVDGERIGKDIGGGICQVSTTVFRAAFFAGLPITEWHPHRYRLGFYELDGWPPGLDASILQPDGDPFGGGDFRFENPSDAWMLVESYVDGPRVYVILYGADLGYNVRVSDPWYNQESIPPTGDIELVDANLPAGTIQQTEYAQTGMEIAFQRTVFDRNGDLLWERTFATLFYSRGNVFKVSPDMRGQSPAA